MRREGKNKICTMCGFIARPGGIGSHMRLQHGIKVKTVIKRISDTTGHISDLTGRLSDTTGHISDLTGRLSEISGLSEHVQRPSDYVKKKSAVVEIESVPIFQKAEITEDKFTGGYCYCSVCMKDLKLFKSLFKRAPSLDNISIVCNECLKRYKKEDLHEDTVWEQTAVWWYVPDTNNQKLRIDRFHTENRILLSKIWTKE